MLSSMTSTAFSFCTFRTSGLTICQRFWLVMASPARKRVILSWLRPEDSRRESPVAVVGPKDAIR